MGAIRHRCRVSGGINAPLHASRTARLVFGRMRGYPPIKSYNYHIKSTRKPRNGIIIRSGEIGEDDEEDFGAVNIDDIIQQHAEEGNVDQDDEHEEEEEQEEEEEEEDGYLEPPSRVRQLPELLHSAGCVESIDGIPDIPIENVITCNSDNGSVNSLYVCAPSEDGEEDGHDWANEAGALGAVAVLAARPLPDCVLPVVVVDDLMLVLSKVAAEFYGM